MKFKWNFWDVSKQSTFRLSNSYNIPNCLLQNGQAITPVPAEAVPSQAGAGHLFCLTGSSVRSGVRLWSDIHPPAATAFLPSEDCFMQSFLFAGKSARPEGRALCVPWNFRFIAGNRASGWSAVPLPVPCRWRKSRWCGQRTGRHSRCRRLPE